jgi:hypothetical protein
MSRRGAIALLLVAWSGVASAQTQADPVAFVRALYAGSQRDNPRAWYDENYSARLRQMIDADRADADKNGEVGKFDWDPIINAQDSTLSRLKVSPVSRSGGRAVIGASFRNLGADQHMRFSLVIEARKWAIDDIQSLNKPRWTMTKVYVGASDAFPDEIKK